MLNRPDDTLKWVLLDFQADLRAGQDNRCRLFYGTGVHSQPPAEGISFHQTGDDLQITTGPLTFTVSSTESFPLHSAALDGRDLPRSPPRSATASSPARSCATTASTYSERSWKLLRQLADDDIERTSVFTPEGFTLKSNSPFRDYYEPEPDFFFEPLTYLSQQTGDPKYADRFEEAIRAIRCSSRPLASRTAAESQALATMDEIRYSQYLPEATRQCGSVGMEGDDTFLKLG